jgi:methyl-accepting chemotaxis protein
MKVSTKLSLITGATAVIMLIVGITSVASISNLIQAIQWVSHSKEVLQQINMLLYNLSDTVATQRAYIISDKQPFFDAYKSQIAATEANIEDLRALVSDNPEQLARLKKIEAHVRERLDSLETTIKLYKEKGSAAAFERIRTGKSLQFRIDLQKSIGEMKQYEIDLLDQRDKELRKSTFSSEMTVTFGVLLALVFFGLCNYLFAHAILSCIKQLITASENIKYGRFDLVASTNTDDEFADLAAAFNNIGQQLLVATNKLKQEQKCSEEIKDNLAAVSKELELSKSQVQEISQLSLKENAILAEHKLAITDLSASLAGLLEMCRSMQGFELTGREHVQRITLLNDNAGSSARQARSNGQLPYDKDYSGAIQNLRSKLARLDEISDISDKLLSSLELIFTTAELENARADVPNKMIDVLVKHLKERCDEGRINSREIRSILSAVESGTEEVIESMHDCAARLSLSKASASNICHELDRQAELCHELRILYEDSIVQKCIAFIRSKEKLGATMNHDFERLQLITTELSNLSSGRATSGSVLSESNL